jgi:hypothetical protein
MKASRQGKLESKLEAIENELGESLADALPYTAEHGDGLFENSEFRPEYVKPHEVSERAEHIYRLAKESVELREEIGLPVLGSVGQVFLSASRESANTGNANRRGPRQLASWLIGELGA